MTKLDFKSPFAYVRNRDTSCSIWVGIEATAPEPELKQLPKGVDHCPLFVTAVHSFQAN